MTQIRLKTVVTFNTTKSDGFLASRYNTVETKLTELINAVAIVSSLTIDTIEIVRQSTRTGGLVEYYPKAVITVDEDLTWSEMAAFFDSVQNDIETEISAAEAAIGTIIQYHKQISTGTVDI